MELRSSSELLAWLGGVGSGSLKRGDWLLDLAISQGKVAHPPNPLVEWLYELRDSGMIYFDDTDANRSLHRTGGKLSASDLFLMRGFGLTTAGRASLKPA